MYRLFLLDCHVLLLFLLFKRTRKGLPITHPMYLDNIYFNGFKKTDNYDAGAIFLNNPGVGASPLSSISNATFGFDDVS